MRICNKYGINCVGIAVLRGYAEDFITKYDFYFTIYAEPERVIGDFVDGKANERYRKFYTNYLSLKEHELMALRWQHETKEITVEEYQKKERRSVTDYNRYSCAPRKARWADSSYSKSCGL